MVEKFSVCVFFSNQPVLIILLFIINNFAIYYKDYINHKVKSLQ